MNKKILKINEDKCVGCGDCTFDCPNGVLEIIDNKVVVVSNLHCGEHDDCKSNCQNGAIEKEQVKCEPYDEYKEMEYISQKGEKAISAHLKHLKKIKESEHLEKAIQYLEQKSFFKPNVYKNKETADKKIIELAPKANNWPIQITLIDVNNPIFDNADLLIASECSAFFYERFRQKFIGDRILIMFCPKLDKLFNTFVQKFTQLFTTKNIKSITIVHMETECCSVIEKMIKKALKMANKVITIKDYKISITGEII